MSNNLPALLAELATVAPNVCKNVAADIYAIGDYRFQYYDDTLHAWEVGFTYTCTGLPAYDWLIGALQRVIKGKGWPYMIQYHEQRNQYAVWVGFSEQAEAISSIATEALLTALIAALQQEGNDAIRP